MCLVTTPSCLKVGGQTETERIEKKLSFEEALNGTKVIFFLKPEEFVIRF